MTVQSLDTIQSYHAHIYFESAEQRDVAAVLREEIAQRFSVLIGSWHEAPIGPHVRPMYQVAFSIVEFPKFVPWLMINRHGLAVLVHPNTGYPRRDHTSNATWLGEKLDIIADPLPEHETEPEAAIVPDTFPVIEP